MKAITVRQPWAWAIMHGGKDVENRTRNIAGSYRGPLVIHTGLRYDFDANIWALAPNAPGARGRYHRNQWAHGAALGMVDLVGVHISRMSLTAGAYGEPVCFDDHTPIGLLCSKWAQYDEIGIAHLVLANPRPFPEPIPYKGALGLWNFPDELLPEGFR